MANQKYLTVCLFVKDKDIQDRARELGLTLSQTEIEQYKLHLSSVAKAAANAELQDTTQGDMLFWVERGGYE